MTSNNEQTKAIWIWLKGLVSLIVCVAIIGGSIYAVILINRTEPTAQKIDRVRKSSALVETEIVSRGDYSPKLVVLGTVQPAQDITLSPRVSGQVIEVSPGFVPGGMVRKGELLLRIDPADFENAVSIRESELEQAKASREIEQARQRLAKKELKMLEGSIGETNRSLVMREPQIASIEAEVSAAEASVERAKLDLQRTQVFAPFDAQVLTRAVNIGSQVGSNDELGRLVGTQQYWVIASVPVRNLRWIEFPGGDATGNDVATGNDAAAESEQDEASGGSQVWLRNREIWGPDVKRSASVSKLIGTLDQRTRMARVLITVDDPLGRQSEAPAMILETLVETEISGKPINDVFRISRDYVRDQDTVWVMKDSQLEIREVDIVFRDERFAYVRSGLDDGDEVVTTTLATVAEGVGLRKVDPEDGSDAPDSMADEEAEQ